MRIALVTDTYLPEVNGVTTVLGIMRAGLAQRGHDVLVVAPAYPPPPTSPAPPDGDGVVRRPSIPCPGYSQVRLSWPWSGAVRRGLDGFAPDVVHVVTEGPLGGQGRRWALARGRPLVTSFHTDFPRYAARYVGQWAVGPTRRYMQRFHGPARLTQTPSAVTRAELVALGLRHAVVWGRGVDSDLFTPARRSDARRAELGVGDGLLVLHVGRLAAEKDIGTLVQSFTAARERLGERAVFCVAGDGPRREEVRGGLPWARHLGFLDRRVLADLYADSDLFVFPSPTETCGLVALEAMASGLPVVAADQGGVLENLRHGLNGLVVRAGDAGAFTEAVVSLADDRARREAMSQAARAFAVARDWGRELDALVDMYAGLPGRATLASA